MEGNIDNRGQSHLTVIYNIVTLTTSFISGFSCVSGPEINPFPQLGQSPYSRKRQLASFHMCGVCDQFGGRRNTCHIFLAIAIQLAVSRGLKNAEPPL